jgi:rhodanese-related sulfurtransferase
MLETIKNLFGFGGSSVDFAELKKQGAVILDVRTRGEYQSGHIKGSVNIPLNELPSQLSKLKKDKPIITCCASGMRSSSARSILTSNGFNVVHNGGGWTSLNGKL